MNSDRCVRENLAVASGGRCRGRRGKGANLGELVAAGLPVPPAFVLLWSCCCDSMRVGGVDRELSALRQEALANAGDTARLTDLCQRMPDLVGKAGVEDRVHPRSSPPTTGSDRIPL